MVGLIGAIRRMLVVTLEAADLIKDDNWIAGGPSVLHACMLAVA